jgi:hypothetical protein
MCEPLKQLDSNGLVIFGKTGKHQYCSRHPEFDNWIERKREADKHDKTIDEHEYFERCKVIISWFENAMLRQGYGIREMIEISDTYKGMEYKKREEFISFILGEIYGGRFIWNVFEGKNEPLDKEKKEHE